jgi:hypothetical protein
MSNYYAIYRFIEGLMTQLVWNLPRSAITIKDNKNNFFPMLPPAFFLKLHYTLYPGEGKRSIFFPLPQGCVKVGGPLGDRTVNSPT